MCGLTGYMDTRHERPAERQILRAMTGTLRHRGPDTEGYFVEGAVGLGFRRLRIIDLETGDQPITNEDGSLVLLCNGEIFNEPELRRDLAARGHIFKTRSDVEVLLHLYEEYGHHFLNRINGQFAFVIYDRRRRTMFMARDHFGINPLHYAFLEDTLIFGSEIKAMLAHPLIRPRVDLTGLDQLLSFPGPVSPRTLFKGILSLPAGHALLACDGEPRVFEYWDLDYPREDEARQEHPETYYREGLEAHLRRAVRRRLRADVPVGFYLSGGLDSSLIAAMGAEELGETPATFSIIFDDPEISERLYQRLMADALGSRHHETRFDAELIADQLSQMVYHGECPVKETFDTCAMSLSAMARERDMTVILAGQGADELFAGYVGYRVDQSGTRERQDGLEAMLEDQVREQLWGDASIFYEKNQHAYRETKTALYSPGLNRLFPEFDCVRHDLVNRERLAGRHVLHQRSYLDFKLRLQDHLLSEHGDRMVMMHSVEGRYPMLDIDLVDFATTIPPELKLKGYEEKYILKQTARPWVPREIITREKFGFRAPASPFLLRRNIAWIEDLLAYERIKRQGYFNADTVEHLKRVYRDPQFKLNPHLETDLLMVVLTFGLFLDLFNLPDFT